VKALVCLNALALEAGESNLDISERFTGGKVADALRPQPFPQVDGSEGTDLYIDPASVRPVFAADVPPRTATRMATAQRPVTLAALQEKSTGAGLEDHSLLVPDRQQGPGHRPGGPALHGQAR
jgi:hypothetical protein